MREIHGYKIFPPNEKEKYFYLKRLCDKAEKGNFWAIMELVNRWGFDPNDSLDGYEWGNGARGS